MALVACGGVVPLLTAKITKLANGNPVMSNKKKDGWKKFLEGKLKEVATKNKGYMEKTSEEINRILEKISCEVKRVSDDSAEERSRLHSEMKDLNKWGVDLKESIYSVQGVKRNFEQLLRK